MSTRLMASFTGNKIQIFVVIIYMLGYHATDAGDWSYLTKHRTGPQSWAQFYKSCGGEQQSPINFNSSNLTFDPQLGAIQLTGYEASSGKWLVKNNGYHVTVELPPGITIQGSKLSGLYEAAQFHFHWGSTDGHGSEHLVDGHRYPMELHVVHYNTKYGSMESAASKDDGLAVLGVFIEVGNHNHAYEELTSKLPKIQRKGDSFSMAAKNMRAFLPRDVYGYFRYHGSLTTPPCYESVTWTVFEQTVKLSQDQIGNFRAMHFESEPSRPDFMVNNFRSLQPMGKRVVFTSRDYSSTHALSQNFKEKWFFVAVVALMFFVLGRASIRPKASIFKED